MQGHDADAHTYVLVFTTIFRTKGLEFDYVFVPEVMHGSMPVTGGTDLLVWDTARSSGPRVSTSQLENERRLFYVALTRAKKAVYLGITQASNQVVSQFIDEMHLAATKAIMQNVRESRGTVQSTLRDVLRKVGASSSLRAQLYEYYASQVEQLRDILADASIGTWPAVHAPVAMTDYKKTAKPLVSPKRWWAEE